MLTLSEQSCLEFWFGRTDFEDLLSAFTLHFTRPFALTREPVLHPPTLGLFRYLFNFCPTTPRTTTNKKTAND